MLDDGGNPFGAWIGIKYTVIGRLSDVNDTTRLLGAILLLGGVAKVQ